MENPGPRRGNSCVRRLWASSNRYGVCPDFPFFCLALIFFIPTIVIAPAIYTNQLSLGNNGAYLENSQIANPLVETVKPWATSAIEAERLWDLSERLVEQKFSY